jgi:hypothetical protein
MAERRRAERVRVGSFKVRLPGICEGVLIDLSMLGALVKFPFAQVADNSLRLAVDFADQSTEFRARVVRSTPDTGEHLVALEFEDLSMDQLVALSRVIDSELVA